MKVLDGKVAIVTGAGRTKGIGRATALKLAEQGANVVVTDIARKREELTLPGGVLSIGDDFTKLEKLVSEIECLGPSSLAMAVDITDKNQIEACVQKTCEVFGGIDILFNNAGTAVGGASPFMELTDRQWDLSYQVNIKGTVDFCKAVIPKMQERNGGSIINNASQAGIGATENQAAYVATKFGVVGLTKTIAREFGRYHIRCNAVCPGFIHTGMWEDVIKFFAKEMGASETEAWDRMSDEVAMKRFAQPEEVADAVAYLAGPAAGYITGVALQIAGGLPPGL
jgi:NAD(P)-dependent dehydrogenase (short-subunit alcohol dehydrogenase family)